ncbi:hypothetical protein JCM13664_15690 [Methylothermus subterraneus]
MNIRRWAGIAAWLAVGASLAEPKLHLELDRLRYGPVVLEGVLLEQSSSWLKLALDRLRLPFAPRALERLSLACPEIRFTNAALTCPHGQLALYLPHLGQALSAALSFILAPAHGQVDLKAKRFAGGSMHLQAKYLGSFSFQLEGKDLNLHDVGFTRVVKQLTLLLKLDAHRANAFHFEFAIPRGEALYLPVYLPFKEHPLKLIGEFAWPKGELRLENLRVSQQNVLTAFAQAGWRKSVLTYLWADFAADCQKLFSLYALPFLQGSRWEGIEVTAGKLHGQMTQATGAVRLERVVLSDQQRRLGFDQLDARLHWRARGHPPLSRAQWRAGHLYALPIGAAALSFGLSGDDFHLHPPADIPVLDGHLHLDQLDILDLATAPQVRFRGQIAKISLELLSRVLGWPQLKGSVSGEIPQVTYDLNRRTLALDGRLIVQVFSGTLVIERLAITDLFGALPRLRADVYVHDLDLEQLTGHFAFGRITGKLEGYIRRLELENWRPVAFDAWFGTPPNDRTRHRISQKAVENLTKLGGRFAAGLLSRTLLRAFDEFSYARLGLGCRLQGGVCELAGVAHVPGGYFIVIGSGLPRIDVIGYNRRIDWPTLIRRLARITQPTPTAQP